MSVLPVATIELTNSSAVVSAGQAFVDAVGARVKDPDEDSKEIKRLRSKHKYYAKHEENWKFMLRAYEGGPDYIAEDTLFKHQREHREDYNDRLKRAHYQNYCQSLVDFVPEYIFSQDVERNPPADVHDEYELWKVDVDRSGTELNAFMQTIAEDMRIFGMVYIQVDLPVKPAELANKADVSVQDALEYGLTVPYFVNVRPLEVLDWATDAKGDLLYLKRVEYTSLPVTANIFAPCERYSEWYPDHYTISVVKLGDEEDDEPTLGKVETKENTWGTVPFVPVYFKRLKSNRDIGLSFLQDIAYQNRAVFNNTSLIDEFLHRQCFNILAMPMKSQVAYKDQVEGQIGTSNILEIPSDSSVMPQYISPPVDPAQFIQAERESTIREMYRQAAQDVTSELMSPGRFTGDSVKQQFARTIPVINKTADALQYAETRAMKLWCKIQGQVWDGKISYKDDYSVTNLMDLLLQLSMIFKDVALFSVTFIKEEWKRVVREFDGKIDPVTLAQIFAEIDGMSEADIKERLLMAQGGMGAAGQPPTTANVAQGKKQTMLGSDKNIAAASGSKANTKETLPDSNKRSTQPSKPAVKPKPQGSGAGHKA